MTAFLKPLPIKGKIRLGANQDGGYVVYGKLLKDTDALVTYGIGWDVSFEKQFYQLTKKKILMFDPTMFGKYLFRFRYLGKLQLKMDLWKIYLSTVWFLWNKKNRLAAKEIRFINEGLASGRSNECDTFVNHLQRFGLQGQQLLLKIDIEGAEYDVFRDHTIYEHLQCVNQLVLELHDLKNRLQDLREILINLQRDFELIHVHGNNFGETFTFQDPLKGNVLIPDVLEVTLVRREKIIKEDIHNQSESYPVRGLDFPNNPTLKDYSLEFI